MRRLLLTSIYVGAVLCMCYGQDSAATSRDIGGIPHRFFNVINRKASRLNDAIDRHTARTVRALMKQEGQMRAKFYRLDSNAAKSLYLQDPEKRYAAFLERERQDTAGADRLSGEYLAYADSLHGSLGFIQQRGGSVGMEAGVTLEKVKQLQGKLSDDERLRQYIVERKEQIKQYLCAQRYVPKDMQDLYGRYNVQLYYYSQQLQAYKDVLNDPDKLLKTVLNGLDKVPAFSAFMQSNSYLSGLVSVAGDYNMNGVTGGVQTRAMIDQLIQGQVSSGGANAASALSQSLQSAQGQLQQFKDKLNALGAGGGSADLPAGFKPNREKTKTFLQRLEYGMNVQTVQSSHYFPVTNDIALTLGYRMNEKSIVGIGISYKMGCGQDINHIRVSSQGIGLRSSLDIKIKGNWYASGGFEYNYQQPFKDAGIFRNLDNWQKSGLIGVSKMVPVRAKFFKQLKLQALWDFLSYQEVPRSAPIKFRVGYNF